MRTLGRKSVSKREWGALVGLMLLALLIRVGFLSQEIMVTPDEAYYIRAGQNLLQGEPLGAFGESQKGQPLLPYSIAWVLRFGGEDPVAASRWLSLIVGVLTLIPFHFCVRSFCSLAETFWSDLVYVLAPFAIRYSVWAMPHAYYNLFLVATLLFLLKTQKSGRLLWAGLAGASAWGAYMTRTEVLVIVGILGLAGIIFSWVAPQVEKKGLRLRLVGCFLLTLILLVIPHAIWIRKATGIWQLTWTAGEGATGAFLEILPKGLNPTLSFEESIGLSRPLLFYPYFYFRELARIYFSLMPDILPLFIWILIALGMVSVASQGREGKARFLLTVPFLAFPFFFYPLVGVEPRYLYSGAIFLIMFSGAGINFLCKFGEKKLACVICFTVLMLNFIPGYGVLLAGYSHKDEPFEQKQLGEWIRKNYSEPQLIYGSDRRMCFYAGPACKEIVRMHLAEEPVRKGISFETFLAQQGVNLVVADSRYVLKYYPTLAFLLENRPSKALTKVFEVSDGPERIILYQFDRTKVR